jgi:hypothetical protein
MANRSNACRRPRVHDPRSEEASSRRPLGFQRASDAAAGSAKNITPLPSSWTISGLFAEGELWVAPVRKFGAPIADTIGPMSYVQLNSMLDDAFFPYGGVQRYWKSSFLKQLGDDVLGILVDRATTMPSPMSMVGFLHVRCVASQVGRNETAFGRRDDQWDYDIISQWLDIGEPAPRKERGSGQPTAITMDGSSHSRTSTTRPICFG